MGKTQTETGAPSREGALLEREPELAAISAAIARARAGEGGALLIEGSAGIGKTALLGRAAEQAAAEGLDVLNATGRQLEREFPFGLALQLLEPAITALEPGEREEVLAGGAEPAAALLGGGGGHSPLPDQAFAIIHGLYWLAANLAERRPLVLVVDDLHWGDALSLQALAYLMPRASELPLLLLLARRTGEPGAASLDWLESRSDLELLRPAALSSEGTAEVVRTFAGADASVALVEACHTATGGNPFLIRELARAIAEDALDHGKAGAEQVARLAPETVSRSTLARIQALDPDARAMALALAVLERAELRHAAALAEIEETAAANAAAALSQAGIFASGLPLRFAHPLLRTTVYAELPAATREIAHRRAARLLADGGAEADIVASHLLETEPRNEAWAVEALREAAGRAHARGAPPIAGRLLKRALAEYPQYPAREELLLERAEAYLLGGHPHARAAFEELVGGDAGQRTRASAIASLAQVLTIAGETQEALELVSGALDEIADLRDPELEVRLLFSFISSAYGEPEAASTLTAALERSRPEPHSVADSARAAGLAFNLSIQSDPAQRVIAFARQGLADDRLSTLGNEGVFLRAIAAWALATAAQVEDALRELDRLVATAAKRGSTWLRVAVASVLVQCRWVEQGLVSDALAEIGVLETAAGFGPYEGTAAFGQLLHCDVLIDRGDLAAAANALASAEEILGRAQHYWTPFGYPLVRSRLRLHQGDAERALADALVAGEACDERGVVNPALCAWRSHAARAAARLGDLDRARELCAEELRFARRAGAPRAIGAVLRTAGLIEAADEGSERLREAVEVLAGSHAQLEHAKALVDLGSALRRAGQRGEAAEPLRQGMDLAHRCGATATVERARDELAALGARPRRLAISGRESLTPSELRVCELAAQGINNREIAERLFVTRRTVETHLTHAYGKLEISGREELAAALEPQPSEQL